MFIVIYVGIVVDFYILAEINDEWIKQLWHFYKQIFVRYLT
jgi:hypothetical protein